MDRTAPSSEISTGVTKRTMFWYALPQIPHGFALLPVVNYVPSFYAGHLGLPFAIVGLMLVLTRVTDIITDPIIGAMSDQTKSRFGRRKPFIVIGLPILMLATWFVFVPPVDPSPPYLFWGLFLMYLGFTIVDIPYTSWGAELSSDYDERSSITALRGAFNSLGSLVTLSIPVIMQAMGQKDLPTIMMAMAIAFIILQPTCFALALWLVPERPAEEIMRQAIPLSERIKAIVGNGALLRLLAAITLLISGMAIGATLNMIIFTHVVGQPDFFAPVVFLQNVVAIAALPIWLKVAARHGKHRAMAIAIGVIGLATAATFAFGQGDGYAMGACVLVIGFGMGAALFLVSSMIADIVDQDLLLTGQERTGLFVAATGMASKFAIVLGVLIGTAIPGLAGFQPSDAVHSPQSLFVLRAVYAFVCPLLAIPAIAILWNYPLDRAKQAQMRAEIDAARSAHRGIA
jgi:glycoside/pentoside/hexuronide:cation symporter, GPH family